MAKHNEWTRMRGSGRRGWQVLPRFVSFVQRQPVAWLVSSRGSEVQLDASERIARRAVVKDIKVNRLQAISGSKEVGGALIELVVEETRGMNRTELLDVLFEARP